MDTKQKIDVSILIPARNEIYLQATIDDLLKNMESNIEIIVGLDDYWPNPPIKDDPKVIIYHSAERIGMRPMINKLASISNGKYLMKTDAHCSFDKGYDQKLISICEQGYTVLGIRYELDVEKWERKERTNCDFRYLSNPEVDERGGLRGLPWHEYKERTKGQEIAETMSISGSGWLMERQQFEAWGGLDENHGTFGQEGCEIACKTWLSGGRVLVNRRTWYAHWNRGKAPYALSTKQRDQSVNYSIDYWMNDRWPLQKYSFKWLLEKFAPVPGWTDQSTKEIGIPAPRQGTLYKGFRFKYRDEKTDMAVIDLWEKRLEISEPLKRHRLKIFFDSFFEIIKASHEGKKYTIDEIENTKYFHYLVTHLPKSDQSKLSEKSKERTIGKFKRAIKIFEDIKKNGLKTPLQCYAKDGKLILWKGYRRLVMAYVLGMERIPICIHQSEQTAKALPAKFQPATHGSIVEKGQEQFQEYLGKSTDKYWVHEYLEIYDNIWSRLRDKKIKLLELGVARGASLRLWHGVFPRGLIYGVDKNQDLWKEMAGDLDRISVFIGKQQDKVFIENQVAKSGPFDIIIDDAGHNPDNQMISFELLWPHVKAFGWYVIEDCYISYLKRNAGRACVPAKLATWIDKIYLDHSVLSIQFYYNIVIIQKGIVNA